MNFKKSNIIKGATLVVALSAMMAFNSSPSYAKLGDENLSHGMHHNDVATLQEELKDLNLYNQDINTYFGKTTEYAVRVFQIDNGLKNTGLFDKNTYNKLQEVKIKKEQAKEEAAKAKEEASKPAPAPVKSKGQEIADTAKKFVGSRYVYGGSSPSGFDCSGFTSYVYKQYGVNIPRTSSAQRNAGKSVSKTNMKLGDILAFQGHVGIYVGDGKMVHASNSTRGVVYDNVNSAYYSSRLLSVRRIVD